MNSSKRKRGIARQIRDIGHHHSFVHRFSDSLLHTGLLIAVVMLAALALVKAVDMGITIWQLDRVVIQGQSLGSSR